MGHRDDPATIEDLDAEDRAHRDDLDRADREYRKWLEQATWPAWATVEFPEWWRPERPLPEPSPDEVTEK